MALGVLLELQTMHDAERIPPTPWVERKHRQSGRRGQSRKG